MCSVAPSPNRNPSGIEAGGGLIGGRGSVHALAFREPGHRDHAGHCRCHRFPDAARRRLRRQRLGRDDRRAEPRQPGHLRPRAARRRGRRRSGGEGRSRRVRGLAGRGAARERGRMLLRIADAVEARTEELARTIATETGNALRTQARPEAALTAGHLPLLRRSRGRAQGRDPAARRARAELHAPRAHRGGGRDHPLERAGASRRPQDRAPPCVPGTRSC